MTSKIQLALPYVLGLYFVSLFTSMAGMEMFGWLSAFCGLLLYPEFVRKGLFDRRLKLIFLLLAALFIFNVLSAMINGLSSKEIITIMGRMRWTIFLMLLIPSLTFLSDEKLFKILKFVTVLAGVISVYAIFQHITGQDLFRPGQYNPVFGEYLGSINFYRSTGIFGSSITFSNSFGLFAAAVFGYVLATKNFRNPMFAVVTVLSAIAVFTTYTRGAWFGYAGSALVGIWLFLSRKKAVAVTGIAAAPIVLVFILSSAFRTRIFDAFNSNSVSGRDRLNLWAANWEMFKEFPLLGVGYGRNEDLALTYFAKLGIDSRFGGHAHNTLLQFMSGTGIIGTVLFIAISVMILMESYKLAKSTQKDLRLTGLFGGLLLTQVFLILSGFTECNFKDAEVNHFSMVIFGLILSHRIVTDKRVQA